ncbi:aldo/keto reductase [Truepera radiovictrix]|uniref:Aldo/keto reductase n=1 Tax=Truepera radiovictrix (strain DSM 17093 / CIP 108686 / LMG 22925 / RQ-24) TaxID=649638 RepID=D7CQU2_TRURR|nr:aldo/keto reductase [Truepera radiovictrix]ADI15076.1 aldo/keto reductase [Truepera radiovictrix DSM 17093]WMT56371.1 aldo/keto reductase [Truepera radiovictrix]
MKTYRIPHTDLEVSRLAYGTWHLGGSWDKTPLSGELKERANALLVAAFEYGINHIDLADIYTLGKSDEAVGYALQHNPGLREKLVLQQKAGIIVGADPDYGPPGRYDFSYEHLVGTVEASLKRLGTDYVDLLAFHRPDPLADLEEVARAADYLYREGRVRYFGVSNHSPMQIALLQKHLDKPLVVNQLELNLLHHHLISSGILVNQTAAVYANTAETLEYCRLHDILIQAWSPVAGGRLFNPADDAPENVRSAAALIAQLAEEKGTTKEAVALAWLLRHPAPIQPILGTLKVDRLADSVRADEVTLTRTEWYRLLEAARGAPVP